MSTTISGTTGVSQVQDGAISTPEKLGSAVVTSPKMSGAQTGNAPLYGARAWCVFNGTTPGTNAPLAGGNVASVARAGTGTYTVTFTTAMPDTNYAVLATPLASALATPRHIAYNTKNTTSVVIYTTDTAGAAADPTDISIVVLG